MTALAPPLRIASSFGSLEAYAYGAQAVQWTPAGARDSALWLSPVAALREGTAIRGGVPVCFPWFGPGRSGAMKPAHGFARTRDWQVIEGSSDSTGAHIVMHLDSSMASDPQFPHRYRAELRIDAAADLLMELCVVNEGDSPFSFEEALHAYLTVSDVESITVEGLDGATYADKAAGGTIAQQQGVLTLSGEVDRAYRSSSDVVVHDGDRRIRVTKTGSASTIVWNPGELLSSTMADIGGHWREFVCIEAGNVLADAIELQPGDSHMLGYRLEVG